MHWIGCTAHLTQYFIVRDIEYFMKNKNIVKNITRLLLIYKTNSSITVLNEPNIKNICDLKDTEAANIPKIIVIINLTEN